MTVAWHRGLYHRYGDRDVISRRHHIGTNRTDERKMALLTGAHFSCGLIVRYETEAVTNGLQYSGGY